MAEIVGPSSLGLTFAVSSLKAESTCIESDVVVPPVRETAPHTLLVDGTTSCDDVKTGTGQQQHIPVLSVNLERLVGYLPETNDEIDSIKNQLVEAMWERYRQQRRLQPEHVEDNNGNGGDSDESPMIVPPPDFDDQIRELLDAKVARFGIPNPSTHHQTQLPPDKRSTSPKQRVDAQYFSSSPSSSTYFVLSYPPKLLLKGNNESTLTTVANDVPDTGATRFLNTEEVWNEIDRLEVALASGHSKFRPYRHKDQIDEYGEKNEHDDDYEEEEEHEDQDVTDSYIDENYYYHDDDLEEPPSVEFLTKLAQHLRDTSRPVLWKHAMAIELQLWIKEESARRAHQDWVQSERQAKLDHLYSVRETLVHQAQLARDKYTHLDEIREDQVKQNLLQYTRREKARVRLGQSVSGEDDDHEFLDEFGSSQLSFPEEFQLLGMMPDDVRDMDDEDDWGTYGESEDDHRSSSSGSESDVDNASGVGTDRDDDVESSKGGEIPSERPRGMMENSSCRPVTSGVSSSTEGESPLQTKANLTTEESEGITSGDQCLSSSIYPVEKKTTTLPFLRRKERRVRERLRKRAERMEAQHKVVEVELREKYTTKALILAQTLLQAMESKVERVEELLESLQDEVWAEDEDEDDCESRDRSSDDDMAALEDTDSKLSLLDQVLAMILGALPIEHGCDPQAHFEYVRQEHAAISRGWKAYFS